jgi:hypothetical protein
LPGSARHDHFHVEVTQPNRDQTPEVPLTDIGSNGFSIALIAILLDTGLGAVEKQLVPRGLRVRRGE